MILLVAAALGLAGPRAAAEPPAATVGMPGQLVGLVLPGSELEAKPLDRKLPIVLRVVAVHPHGTLLRYDLEYSGFAPGRYDLRDYLRRKDGTPLGEVPAIPVTIEPVLPPGQIQPNRLVIEEGPRVGGYRTLVIVASAVWGIVLVALVGSFFYPRRRRASAPPAVPVSLADRLRPLVEGAVAGRLSQAELANLERSLLAYWRRRLQLEATAPGEAVDRLRRDAQAGPLLAQLEVWLHRPGPAAPVDVPTLLAPYRALPPEAIDLGGSA